MFWRVILRVYVYVKDGNYVLKNECTGVRSAPSTPSVLEYSYYSEYSVMSFGIP
jgi:hypothetical protein